MNFLPKPLRFLIEPFILPIFGSLFGGGSGPAIEVPEFVSAFDDIVDVGGQARDIEEQAQLRGIETFQRTRGDEAALSFGQGDQQSAFAVLGDLLQGAGRFTAPIDQTLSGISEFLQGPAFDPIQNRQIETSPLLQTSFQQAQADLDRGGRLDPAIQAEIARQSQLTATAGGFAGTPIGRDIELRDLGVSQLAQLQRAQDRAERLGGTQQGIRERERTFQTGVDQFNRQLAGQRGGALQSLLGTLQGAQFQPVQFATQVAQQSRIPTVFGGQDFLNAFVSDVNARNAFNQQQAAIKAQQAAQKQKQKSGLGSGIGSLIGGIAGSVIPGIGTAIGSAAGGAIGGAIAS